MSDAEIERKLAVILYADVADYSRLTGEDELGTHKKLGASLDLISAQITKYDGAVVHYAGDAVLAKFASVVAAVKCAVSFQKLLEAENWHVADKDQLRYRVGINLGEVIIDRDDIYGDGVNIAARLESLADPGGICISQTVRDQVSGKLDLQFEDMGDQNVKNIASPVHAYRLLPAGTAGPQTPVSEKTNKPRIALWLSAGAVMAVALAILIWQTPWQTRHPPKSANTAPESVAPTVAENIISLAVLPFNNLSNDEEQEYFSDGMTEDLITDLSKVSALTVTSRTSTFSYKGKSPDIRAVAKELNVRYVLEGSVRKFAGRIRINAQLIDATTGNHIWAERYDRDFKDIFSVQDEVREKIVAALAVSLTPAEKERLAHPRTNNAEAYDFYLKGLQQESFFTPNGNTESKQYFEQAIDLDPSFAAAYAHLAQAYSLAAEFNWTDDPLASLKRGLALAKNAIALDDDLAMAHWSLARLYSRRLIYNGPLAISEAEKAIELEPKDGANHAILGVTLTFAGQAEKGIIHIKNAIRLNPEPPYWYYFGLGMANYFLSRYDSAIENFERLKEQNSSVVWSYWFLASIYGQLGQLENAKWELSELEIMGETLTIEAGENSTDIMDPTYGGLYLEGLRKAGVPEE